MRRTAYIDLCHVSVVLKQCMQLKWLLEWYHLIFNKFIEQEIAQLGLLIVQIYWTKRCDNTLQEAMMNKNLMNETNKYFLDMLNQFIEKTTCMTANIFTLLSINVWSHCFVIFLFLSFSKSWSNKMWLQWKILYPWPDFVYVVCCFIHYTNKNSPVINKNYSKDIITSYIEPLEQI